MFGKSSQTTSCMVSAAQSSPFLGGCGIGKSSRLRSSRFLHLIVLCFVEETLETMATSGTKKHRQALYRVSTFRHQCQCDSSLAVEGMLSLLLLLLFLLFLF